MGRIALPLHNNALPAVRGPAPRARRILLGIILFCVLLMTLIYPYPREHLFPRLFRQQHGVIHPTYIRWERETTLDAPVPRFDTPLLSQGGLIRPFANNTIPEQVVPVFPRNVVVPPHAPKPESVLFALTTTAKRAREYSTLWPHFMHYGSRCLLMLAPGEAHLRDEVEHLLTVERGLRCTVRVSDVDKYEVRMMAMPREGARYADEFGGVEWLVIADDDTFFVDFKTLQRMLAKYDTSESLFVGSVSEGLEQRNIFGRQVFGGGGIFLTPPMFQKMAERFDECARDFSELFGGDTMLTHCAARALDKPWEEVLIEEAGIHQFDLHGSGAGFLQSGLPFISLHHMIAGWTDLIPKHMPVRMSEDWTSFRTIMKAAQFLGGDNLFRRFVFDGGRTLLCLGHSLIVYEKPLTNEDLTKIEYTLGWPGIELIDRYPVRPEPRKRFEYFISSIDVQSPTRMVMHFEEVGGRTLDVVWDEENPELGRASVNKLWKVWGSWR